MRATIAVVILLSAAVGCSADRLTGASAQRAVAEGKAHFSSIPDSIAVFVDDVRLPAGSSLDHIRPESIERVEVVKRAGFKGYVSPEDIRGIGAILIYTKKAR